LTKKRLQLIQTIETGDFVGLGKRGIVENGIPKVVHGASEGKYGGMMDMTIKGYLEPNRGRILGGLERICE
jgi:hypothetical protein